MSPAAAVSSNRWPPTCSSPSDARRRSGWGTIRSDCASSHAGPPTRTLVCSTPRPTRSFARTHRQNPTPTTAEPIPRSARPIGRRRDVREHLRRFRGFSWTSKKSLTQSQTESSLKINNYISIRAILLIKTSDHRIIKDRVYFLI